MMKRNLGFFSCFILVSFIFSCSNESSVVQPIKIIDVVENSWRINFPATMQNSVSPKKIEIRLLKDTNHPTFSADVNVDSNSIELSNVSDFPPVGKIYTFNGETISYKSISGTSLHELSRGMDQTIPQSHTKGQAVYLIKVQQEIGDKMEYLIPQLPDNYYIHYRWQIVSKENSDKSWSNFEMAGFAPGKEGSISPK